MQKNLRVALFVRDRMQHRNAVRVVGGLFAVGEFQCGPSIDVDHQHILVGFLNLHLAVHHTSNRARCHLRGLSGEDVSAESTDVQPANCRYLQDRFAKDAVFDIAFADRIHNDLALLEISVEGSATTGVAELRM